MSYKDVFDRWYFFPELDPVLKKELESIKGDEKAIENAFYAPLSFGTAGLRGIMGAGINRMNIYTVAQATQGLAAYINSHGTDAAARGCAIAYDCRNMSTEFAEISARVLAANGIKVLLFDSLRPTPELSFAVRQYNCIAGINITASHNPKEYNGYKVYWEDGAQISPAAAETISGFINSTDPFGGVSYTDFDNAVAAGTVKIIGSETDELFYGHILSDAINPGVASACGDSFKIVYTPFHGAGYKAVPEILSRLGFKSVFCVPEQMVIDGNFPTVKSPNPENKEGFTLAAALAEKTGADLIIGTDPDADRVGIIAKNSAGEYVILTGNQTGALLLHYIITSRRENGSLSPKAAAITTVVSSRMPQAICEKNGIRLDLCFTGFKFIAERMNLLLSDGYQFLLGFEESYGYLLGTHARDKDSIGASAMIAEMTAYYHLKGKTLADVLSECYNLYGYYSELTINLVMPGIDGLEKMKTLMKRLRSDPPKTFGSFRTEAFTDYSTGKTLEFSSGIISETPAHLRDSDVLAFDIEGGAALMIRPSGTEPKIKVYLLAKAGSREAADDMIKELSDAVNSLV